ncbi:hypothetical protein HJG60_012096 [Phyllostomus discolor]|uniref:Uncharacterized protein n=1 Tax=Phyllostomus discolor TaxID=89673 RepID=A0A833ZM72_9CHIR|nr:hypothetical protein HJG60_012096 [Phyllostomus discolor]
MKKLVQTLLVHASGRDGGENPRNSTVFLQTAHLQLQQLGLGTVRVLTFPIVAGSDVRGVGANLVWNLQREIVTLWEASTFEGLAAVFGGLRPAVPNTNRRREQHTGQPSCHRDSLLDAGLPWLSLVVNAICPSPLRSPLLCSAAAG